jgi:hypothetical protein
MLRIKSLLLSGALFGVFLCCPNALAQSSNAVPTAPSSAEAQLLRALLDEVRQLRIALQRAQLTTYRGHLLADRLKQQQSRVDGLTEEIAQLRAQLQQEMSYGREEEQLRELEAAINRAPDPVTRAQLTQTYEDLKRTIQWQKEYARQDAERNSARQQMLEVMLRDEHEKLAQIQGQLDALDRELERMVPEIKPQR